MEEIVTLVNQVLALAQKANVPLGEHNEALARCNRILAICAAMQKELTILKPRPKSGPVAPTPAPAITKQKRPSRRR